jgi:dephospho-CoA kinase
MFANKPIIGVVGGIGSGKSFIARLFGEVGCLVIDSDAQVREAYRHADVKQMLVKWWGTEVLTPEGEVDRRAIARIVFEQDDQRRRLELLLHPIVNLQREKEMAAAAHDPDVIAYIWDTPLLVEAGLYTQCDAVIYVDAPLEDRLKRVMAQRGWDEAELNRREKLQFPLDRKLKISDYQIVNTTDLGRASSQVREILSRIVTGLP